MSCKAFSCFYSTQTNRKEPVSKCMNMLFLRTKSGRYWTCSSTYNTIVFPSKSLPAHNTWKGLQFFMHHTKMLLSIRLPAEHSSALLAWKSQFGWYSWGGQNLGSSFVPRGIENRRRPASYLIVWSGWIQTQFDAGNLEKLIYGW